MWIARQTIHMICQNKSKDTQEVPQSRSIAFPRYQQRKDEEQIMTNNDKTNQNVYETTDAQRQ